MVQFKQQTVIYIEQTSPPRLRSFGTYVNAAQALHPTEGSNILALRRPLLAGSPSSFVEVNCEPSRPVDR